MKYTSKLILNGETYQFGKQEGWQPGANTVLYVPMDADLLDHGPNNITVTNSGDVSVGTVGGLSAGYFSTNSSYLSAPINNYISVAPFTVSCWVYRDGTYWADNTASVFGMYISGPFRGTCIFHRNDHGLMSERLGSGWLLSDEFLIINTWNHVTLTLTGSESILYLNGTAIGNVSGIWDSTFENFFIGRDWNDSYRCWSGYLSNFIMESSPRTAQEVSDYYNQTKSLYGIS